MRKKRSNTGWPINYTSNEFRTPDFLFSATRIEQPMVLSEADKQKSLKLKEKAKAVKDKAKAKAKANAVKDKANAKAVKDKANALKKQINSAGYKGGGYTAADAAAADAIYDSKFNFKDDQQIISAIAELSLEECYILIGSRHVTPVNDIHGPGKLYTVFGGKYGSIIQERYKALTVKFCTLDSSKFKTLIE